MSYLRIIIGKALIHADLKLGNTRLLFYEDIVVVIYNKYKLLYPENQVKSGVVGSKVADISEEEHMINIEFESGGKIIIDMSDDGYCCPEAMQLIAPNMPIVIWN